MKQQTAVSSFLASSAMLSLTTLVASVLGVGLNLVIPFVLPAAEYAHYSLMLGFSQLIASVLFEWTRINVIRFSNTADADAGTNRRAVLTFIYTITAGLLALSAVVFAIIGEFSLWYASAAIVIATAALQGIFDGQQAASRAMRDNLGVSSRTLVRACLALVGSVAAGLVFGTGEAALIGFALAFPLTSLVGISALPGALRSMHFSRPVFWQMLRFGMLSAVGTNLSLAVPAAIRSMVVASVGFAQAGGILLVIDLSQRVFATIGMSINVVVFQNAIHATEFGTPDERRSAVHKQILSLAFIVLPALAAFSAVHQLIADHLVPQMYSAAFAETAVVTTLAMAIMAIRQYSLDPLFVIQGRSIGAPIGPLAMIATLLGFMALPTQWSGGGLQWVSFALLLASLTGVLFTVLSASLIAKVSWPVRDAVGMALICAVMVVIDWAITPSSNVYLAALAVVLLGIVFVVGVAVFDVLGVRAGLAKRLRRVGPEM